MSSPIEWLEAHGAQRDVLDGLAPLAADWRSLWIACPRGDWLLGIAVKLGLPHAMLVSAAVGCARTATDLVHGPIATAGAEVLALAHAWTLDPARAHDVAAATRALEDAAKRATGPEEDAAASAILAVGLGVADASVLPSAPAAAAEAAIVATIDCGLAMAMRWAHDKCAQAVRAAIPWDEVAKRVDHAEADP